MSLDHDAIRKAYSNAKTIDDGKGAFDSSGNKITLVQSNIDAARTTLNNEAAAVKYKTDREDAYADIKDQLDQLWHDIDDGKLDKTGSWYKSVKDVKDANPKPS